MLRTYLVLTGLFLFVGLLTAAIATRSLPRTYAVSLGLAMMVLSPCVVAIQTASVLRCLWGSLSADIGQPEKSFKTLLKCNPNKLWTRDLIGDYYYSLSITYATRSDYISARLCLRAARTFYARTRNRQEQLVITQLDLARIEADSGQKARAMRYCSQMLNGSSDLHQRRNLVAYTTVEIGQIARDLGFRVLARELFQEALRTLEKGATGLSKSRTVYRVASAYVCLSSEALDQQDYDGMRQCIEKARHLLAQLSDTAMLLRNGKHILGLCHLNEGIALHQQGDCDEAIAALEQAIGELSSKDPALGMSCIQAASVSRSLGDTENATKLVEVASQAFDKYADFRAGGGTALDRKLLSMQSRQARQTAPSTMLILSDSSASLQRMQQGTSIEIAAETALHSGIVAQEKGEIYDVLEDHETSCAEFAKAVEWFMKADNPNHLCAALSRLARQKVNSGDLPGAIEASLEAIRIGEEYLLQFSEENLCAINADGLLLAIDICIYAAERLGDSVSTLKASEAFRGHHMVQCISSAPDLALMRNELYALELARTSGNPEEGASRQLIDLVSKFARTREVSADVDFNKLAASLGEDVVYISFHIGQYSTTVHSVKNMKTSTAYLNTQVDESDDDEEQLDWRTRLDVFARFDDPRKSEASWKADGRSWFDLLFPPDIAMEISEAHTVVLSPVQDLWRVPFAALIMPDGKYLGIEKKLIFAHSLAAYSSGASRPQFAEEVLVAGKGDFGGIAESSLRGSGVADPTKELANLPNAVAEAIKVAELYEAAPILDAEATKRRIVDALRHSKIVHFASHAFFSDAQPMSSGIVLSGDEPVLSGFQILMIPLDAEIIVLSACQTARGQHRPGEGLIGLSYAFLRAGARTVVSSLWQVNDASTSELMLEFHSLLRNVSPSDAMAGAMRHLCDRGFTPYHWAPFIVIGQP